MRFKAICLIIFSFGLWGGSATGLEICGELKQGELLLIKADNAKKITVFNNLAKKDYFLNQNNEALVALHRDAPRKLRMAVVGDKGTKETYELAVAPTKWDIQRVDGVAQHKVMPDKSHEKEIAREQKDVGRALTTVSSLQDWRDGFILPLTGGRISGYFGNQRIFNGTPKSPHTGTDIAVPEGTPVAASGSGKVILSGQDYFYTGNMVIIDHGQGLQTIYAHMQKATVQAGDTVHKGDIIGYVGKTGRATGPHLHWGASLNNVRFQPHSLLDFNDKKCHQYDNRKKGEEK